MSASPSCIVHEFPIPDREYYAAAPLQWDEPVLSKPRRRPAPSRVRRKSRRRNPLLLPLLLSGLLFLWGFLLGRAGAVEEEAPVSPAVFSSELEPLPEGPEAGPIQVQTVPGAIVSSSSGGASAGEPSPPADPSSQQSALLPEESAEERGSSAKIRTVPGAVISGSSGASDREDWRLILVNSQNPLPDNFQIPALTQLRNGHAVDSRAYPELQRMMDDCRAEGLEPLICSSYRSWEKQAELFERKVQSCLASAGSRQEAEDQAAEWVSRPGTSEHQAGLALDIVDKSYQLLDEGQEGTAVQRWLMSHCAEYGFILRYPTDKSALTGVGYEPWHYRYVGVEAAREIMSQGLCLEEYLESAG